MTLQWKHSIHYGIQQLAINISRYQNCTRNDFYSSPVCKFALHPLFEPKLLGLINEYIASTCTKREGWWAIESVYEDNRCATYTCFLRPEHVPKIVPYAEYMQFKTLDSLRSLRQDELEVRLKKFLRSPTCCELRLNSSKGIFWVDSQGCLLWRFHPKTGHVYELHSGVCVAKSLPEFLTRIAIENQIWGHLFSNPLKYPLSEVEQCYLQQIRHAK